LTYAAIQQGLTAAFADKSGGIGGQDLQELPASGRKYSYKPDIATEDLFKHDGEVTAQKDKSTGAALRADQLVAASQRPMTVTTHDESPSISKPESARLDAHKTTSKSVSRAVFAQDSAESQETHSSTSDSDNADDLSENASTGITSAPDSKRVSPSHAAVVDFVGSEKTDPEVSTHGKRVRAEFEMYKRLQEERAMMATSKSKDIPAATTDDMPAHKESGASQHAPAAGATTALPDFTSAVRMNSDGWRGRGTDGNEASQGAQRHRSRSRSVTRYVREYFRPGSSAATTRSRKASMDDQHESAGPADHQEGPEEYWSSTAASARRGRWNLWRSGGGQNRQYTTPDYSRPSSATGFYSRLRNRSRAGSAGSVSQEPMSASDPRNDSVQRDTAAQNQFQHRPAKPMIDLNRELPPLPSLDQWKSDDEESDDAYHPGFTKATMTFQQPFITEPLLDESQAIFDPVTPAAASKRPLSTLSIAALPKRVTDINEQEVLLTPDSAHRRSLDAQTVLTDSQQQPSQQMTPASSRNSPRVATIASTSSPSHKTSSPAVSIRHVHSASSDGTDGQLQTVRPSNGLARSISDKDARGPKNDDKHNPAGLYDLSHSRSQGSVLRDANESKRHQVGTDPLNRTASSQRVPTGSKTAHQQRYHLNPLQSHPVSPQPNVSQQQKHAPSQQQQSERASPDIAAAALSKGRRKWWGGREDKDAQKQGRGRFFSSPPPVSHATRAIQVPWQQRY
jgi:hypothetical protein